MASDEKLSLILKSLDKLQLEGDKLKSVASNGIIPVVLTTAKELTVSEKDTVAKFIGDKLGYLVYLETTVDPSIIGGSVLKAGDQIYDASVKRQMEKVSDAMAKTNAKGALTDFSAVTESLVKTVEEADIKPDMEEVGNILKVGDGIATVSGLRHAMSGELVSLKGGVYGMVQNLMPDSVGIVLMGGETTVKQGDIVRRTGKLMQVPRRRRPAGPCRQSPGRTN
jgi:F-type H+/Na+-transporting ATPase subunit alpha